MTEFTENVIKIILSIPRGKVMTYGAVAAYAGSPQAARQVVRILHSSTEKYQLPWHRVISAGGFLKIKNPQLFDFHKHLLALEGVEFLTDNSVDLDKYYFTPDVVIID